MELTDLKVFITVAELGSISRAAQKLDYVQSNVTTRIRKLESELGVSLFQRHPKGVILTQKGTLFRKYVLSILHTADEAIRAVQEKEEPSGSLTVGVIETVTCGKWINLLADFQTQYPEVSLTFLTGTPSDLLDKVYNYEVDAAFLTGILPSTQINIDYSIQDELVMLSNESKQSHLDLTNTRWAVSPKGCPFRATLEDWLQHEGYTLTNLIEISSLEPLLSAVNCGLASTLLPRSVLSGEYATLAAYTIPKQFRYTDTKLVHLKDRFQSKAYKAFVRLVQENKL